ncbi:MAG TPA: hypothetical protein VGO62_01475, partial [Myxococcota bacterium]
GLLLAVSAVVVVLRARSHLVDEDSSSALIDAGPGARDAGAPALQAPIDVEALALKPATTPRSKMLKEALQKRAAEQQAQAQKLAHATSASSSSGGSNSGANNVVLAGDGGLARAMKKKLGSAHVVDISEHGYALSLHADSGQSESGIYSKCSVAVSELPNKKLVASLSDRADAAPGSEREAADACAQALADDLSSWLRAHPAH